MIWTPSKKIVTSRHKQRGNLVLTILPGQDPLYGQVSLLCSCEETNAGEQIITPSKGPTLNWIVALGNGAPYGNVSTVQAKFGTQSLYAQGFTGANFWGWRANDMQLTDFFDFGSAAFTMEMHIYHVEKVSAFYPFAAWDITAGKRCFSWGLSSDTRYDFLYSTTGANQIIPFSQLGGIDQLPMNQWVHIALTRDDSGVISIWQDGVLFGSQGGHGNTFWKPTSTLYATIGAESRANAPNMGQTTTYMDNIRVTRGAARYTAPFTPPTEPFPNF